MTFNSDNIVECYNNVWKLRKDLCGVWKDVTVYDALMFAVSEVGEIADASLRCKDFNRNNEKCHDVASELCDLFVSLCTALPSGINISKYNISITHDFSTIIYKVSIALYLHSNGININDILNDLLVNVAYFIDYYSDGNFVNYTTSKINQLHNKWK